MTVDLLGEYRSRFGISGPWKAGMEPVRRKASDISRSKVGGDEVLYVVSNTGSAPAVYRGKFLGLTVASRQCRGAWERD